MLTYYPALQPYKQHTLKVTPPHELYIEECGHPQGIPILFVHGGPGGGCSEKHRRYFDPNEYRIILFDQRGCGRSTPHGSLKHNNTQALVNDMEAIRKQLGIEQWIVFGGSWGSTLSLVYAQTHPDRTLGLILRGVFLARPQDIQWLFTVPGANQVFPDHWARFINLIPESERHDPIRAYYTRLTGHDELTQMAAAKAWSTWEGQCATLDPNPEVIAEMSEPHLAFSLARLECHYMLNQCFLKPNQILEHMPVLQNIPGIIVHGRYDMVCTLNNAWTLHNAWPQSELNIIRSAGHSSSEPGIVDGLIRATQTLLKRFKA